METMERKQPGAILMVVGGALMVIGSMLTWLTAKIDFTVLADAIKQQTGVDISGAPGLATAQSSTSLAGLKGWEGKLALVGGLIVLGVGIAALVGSASGSLAAKSAAIGGAMGLFGAVYVLVRKAGELADAKASAAPAFAAQGIPSSVFDDALKVSTGIGLYLALVGGVVAIVAGIMLLGKGASSATATAAPPATFAPATDSGFGTPAQPPVSPPVSPPASAPPAPPTTPAPPTPPGDGGGGEMPS